MKLKELRKDRGWTQAKLAAKSGISQTYISELEQGKKQPTLPIIKKLAVALGATTSKLLEEDPTDKEK